jgi:dihydroceramidase
MAIVEHGSMRAADTSAPVGFWGPPTSTIDWCELNYEHSYYIAEFWNTISNSLFVLLGLYGLYRSIKLGFEPRFHLQFIGVMVTGFGSAMFHGTLQHVYQQCDETPMVWAILVWIYIVYNNEIEELPVKHAKSYVIAFLTTIGAVFTVVHAIYRFTTVFQLFFGVLAVLTCVRLCMHYAEVKDERARAVARSYVTSALIGFGFWLMDYHYCHTLRGLPVNPQGHAWYVTCLLPNACGLVSCLAHIRCGCFLPQVAHFHGHLVLPRPDLHAVRAHGAAPEEGAHPRHLPGHPDDRRRGQRAGEPQEAQTVVRTSACDTCGGEQAGMLPSVDLSLPLRCRCPYLR